MRRDGGVTIRRVRFVPSVGWVRRYERRWLGRDVTAGVVTACVVVPQCVAYASLAGLPVEVGLYVATVPMLLYAVLGTSRPLSVSTTSTISLLTASAIAQTDASNRLAAASALAVLVGAVLLVVGLLRLGFLADLVSSPILTGFKTGTGLVIVSGQLGKVLGIPVAGTGFFPNIRDVFDGLDDIHRLTLALGAGTIVLLVALRRLAPRVPAPLVAVVVGVTLVRTLDLADDGVAVVGMVPSGLPGFAFPSPDEWGLLLPAAFGVALMSAVESLAAGRALASRDDPAVNANQDLVALGMANLGAGVFHGYPAGGGLSQSAVNDEAGARTQLAAIVTVGVVVLVITTLTGLLNDLALATLGALVIVAAWGLITPAAFRRLARIRTRDFALSCVALAGVLVFGILDGVLIAIAASIITLLHQVNTRPVEILGRMPGTTHYRNLARHQEAQSIPGLIIVRPRGPLYFANAERVRAEILAAVDRTTPTANVVIADISAVADIEVTALDVLTRAAADLRVRGIETWMAGMVQDELAMLERYGIDEALRIFTTLDDAVTAYTSVGRHGSE
jgi:sulfate permease, SulP family